MGKQQGWRHKPPRNDSRSAQEKARRTRRLQHGAGSVSVVEITQQDVDAWHIQMCQALRFGAMLDNFPSMVERCLKYNTWNKWFCRDKGRTFENPLEYFEHNEPD